MRHTLTPQEFQLVFDVLFHLSQSDFSKRLPEMQSATRLGSIILLLNMIAERLTVLSKTERAAAFGQLITADYFLSDGKLFLSDPEAERQLYILEDRRKDLHNGYSFDTVIAEESLSAFAELVSGLQKGNEAVTLPLSVLLADRRLILCCCEFGPVTGDNFGEMHIIILPELFEDTIVEILYDQFLLELREIPANEAQLLQNTCDYIRTHIDKPLPRLRLLANLQMTNERKLQEVFRKFLDDTIHHYYENLRMSKIFELMSCTDISIYSIAERFGYQDYTHFAERFKLHFGYPPSNAKRAGQNDPEL